MREYKAELAFDVGALLHKIYRPVSTFKNIVIVSIFIKFIQRMEFVKSYLMVVNQKPIKIVNN